MFRKTLTRLAALLVGGAALVGATTGCEVYGPAVYARPGLVVAPAPVVVGPVFYPYYRPYGYFGYYGGWHRGYWR